MLRLWSSLNKSHLVKTEELNVAEIMDLLINSMHKIFLIGQNAECDYFLISSNVLKKPGIIVTLVYRMTKM